jgi:hypothetical protein
MGETLILREGYKAAFTKHRVGKRWKRKRCVAELIPIGKVTMVEMIESEIGYPAANACTV